MVAFNFNGRFADDVEALRKLQTIRAKARAKVGDRLQLYTGQRTAQCRKLVNPDPVCTVSTYCGLHPTHITVGNVSALPERLRDRETFAVADGFRDYQDMLDWFEETYGERFFTGHLTVWEPSPLPGASS